METDYARPVIELVRESPNTKDGMSKVVDTAEDAITQVDQRIAELLSQRDDVVVIYRRFIDLYRVLIGEEMRSKQQIESVTALPVGLGDTDLYRQTILAVADTFQQAQISDHQVLRQARKVLGKMPPGRNPNAVAATILLRSGKWKKIQPGVFQRDEEEEDEMDT